jgi:methanogenic corrinoid protein MtbC1
MLTAIGLADELRRIDSGILELVEVRYPDRLRHYRRGEVLYWQGSRADCVYVLRRGKVKICCISPEGKTVTYEILGTGRIAGATACLLGDTRQATAEALEATEAYMLPLADFEQLLASSPSVSRAILGQVAQSARSLTYKVQDLTFLDVQRRLKLGLVRLATQHGSVTEHGLKIDLHMTHEAIAELIAANRSTITECINQLKAQGYLWQEGRRLVILPPEHIEILDALSRAVIEGDDVGAVEWARKAAAEEVDPGKALEALTAAMRQVDEAFMREDFALPDVVMAAFAMKSAMPTVEQEITRWGQEQATVGTVVIGTVHGDIHDIGKTMVSMLLVANGFRVIDVGVDVPADVFLHAVREHQPDILAMSALMTVTAPEQKRVIDGLRAEGLRTQTKVMVGGGAITAALATKIGADGYEPTARGAVELAKRLSNGYPADPLTWAKQGALR